MIGVAATLLVAGCTAIPTGGGVHAGTPKSDSEQTGSQVRVLPQLPVPGETPNQIVNGFQLASADSADLAAARAFLVDPAWEPEGGVHVIDGSNPLLSSTPLGDHATVHFVEAWNGTIGTDGTYTPQKSGATVDYSYQPEKNEQTEGEWLL